MVAATRLKPDQPVLHTPTGRMLTVIGDKGGIVATFMGLIKCRFGERRNDWTYFHPRELRRILEE